MLDVEMNSRVWTHGTTQSQRLVYLKEILAINTQASYVLSMLEQRANVELTFRPDDALVNDSNKPIIGTS